jgi:hypothetical protein
MTASRWRSFSSALLLLAACGPPRAAPFTQAETDAALAPARDLRARCYVGTALERAGTKVVLGYDLNVAADGSVRSVPRYVEPEEPALVECVRHRLDELRFPARAKDHLNVDFELGPNGAGSELQTIKERTLGTCKPACEDGFSCHYEASAPRGVCRVETGRCRFDRDCAPSQSCQRLAEPLGVCIERTP